MQVIAKFRLNPMGIHKKSLKDTKKSLIVGLSFSVNYVLS